MSSQIFISYRREESRWSARSLYDRLSGHFDRKQIFMDVDAVAPGDDFVKAIEQRVGECDVLIAVIGTHWLTSSDEQAVRRLDSPEDFVRMEIATALRREIRVIPVLVDGALMPRSVDLPDDLKALARRNAMRVSHTEFDDDCRRLVATIEQVLEKNAAEQREHEEKKRLEAERERREEREKQRLNSERLEKERLKIERLERERLEIEQREKGRLDAEQLQNERVAAQQREKESLEAERRTKERQEQEAEALKNEEKERLEVRRKENERLDAERLESKWLEREEHEQVETDRQQRVRLETESHQRKAKTKRLLTIAFAMSVITVTGVMWFAGERRRKEPSTAPLVTSTPKLTPAPGSPTNTASAVDNSGIDELKKKLEEVYQKAIADADPNQRADLRTEYERWSAERETLKNDSDNYIARIQQEIRFFGGNYDQP